MGEDEDSAGWRRDELDNCDCFVHDSCDNWHAENPVEPSSIAIDTEVRRSPVAIAKSHRILQRIKLDLRLMTNLLR